MSSATCARHLSPKNPLWGACVALLMSCAPDPPATPSDTTSGEVGLTLTLATEVTVESCEHVALPWQAEGHDTPPTWTVSGYPILHLEVHDGLRFQAPPVASPLSFDLQARIEGPQGQLAEATLRVNVTPRDRPDSLAAGMAQGCGRFQHGVASGDPGPRSLNLWTRLTPDAGASNALSWRVATDPLLQDRVAEGSATALEGADWTINVVADGLQPGTTYYYGFVTTDGEVSPLGRSRTAPEGPTPHLRFAVASCSSIFSGYFNAYRRMAERADLDAVIHLGDYIYNTIDPDEKVRLPVPPPGEPGDLDSWRGRHAYYLGDPDLRLARAMHPWIVMWDNHDVSGDAGGEHQGSVQAFREWVPMHQATAGAYRRLSFGDLVDVVMLDVLLHRNQDVASGDPESWSILGDAQWEWLEDELAGSQAVWRLIGSQKVMGTVRVNPAFRGGSEFFDLKTWDGFPVDRKRLFGLLESLNGANNVVLSGDSHISLAQDLIDSDNPSVGVELLPTSITRGNFDERLGPNPELYAYLAEETLALNPHHRYLELTQHGYGIVDVTPERVVGQIWVSDILSSTLSETLAIELSVERDSGTWTPL